MSAWPENLPVPLRTVSIQPGRNAVANQYSSGRRIVRNWGGVPPDEVTVQLRLKASEEPYLNYFYHRTGLDGIWFTAAWLSSMGYTDHKARFIRYPTRKGITGNVMDFSISLLVQESSLCVDPDEWQSAGTGGDYSESSGGSS